jgi:hypothetical protein
MVTGIYICQKILLPEITFITFIAKTVIGGCVYLTVIYICDRFFDYGIKKNIESQLGVFAK